MDSVLIGLFSVLAAQIGQIIRTWLTNKKSVKQYSALEKKMDIMYDKMEHSSFIPEFEIKIQSYINSVFAGFTFKNENNKYLARSIAKSTKYIFVNVVKIGFQKFDENSLLDDFGMQDMKVKEIMSSHNLDINEKGLFGLLESERESFLIKIKETIRITKNGERQEEYTRFCKDYILQTVKGVKNL